jgi:hypothetical protein
MFAFLTACFGRADCCPIWAWSAGPRGSAADLGPRISITSRYEFKFLSDQSNSRATQLQDYNATLQRKVESASESWSSQPRESRFIGLANHGLRQQLHELGLFAGQLRGHAPSKTGINSSSGGLAAVMCAASQIKQILGLGATSPRRSWPLFQCSSRGRRLASPTAGRTWPQQEVNARKYKADLYDRTPHPRRGPADIGPMPFGGMMCRSRILRFQVGGSALSVSRGHSDNACEAWLAINKGRVPSPWESSILVHAGRCRDQISVEWSRLEFPRWLA